MNELKAFLFDVDGTLADTEKDGHRIAFNMAFAEKGLNWDWDADLYGQLLAVTGGKERIKYYLESFNTDFERPNDFEDFVKQLHALKTKFYVQLMQAGKVPLRPGVESLIKEAKAQGMRMAIVTTTTPANVTALLENTLGKGSEDWFEVIAAGDIVPAKKPAPDIYHWALDKMGVKASEAIAFEDSVNGLLSSNGANIKTIVTVNDYTQNDDFSDAVVVLDQMGDETHPFKVLSSQIGTLPNAWLNFETVQWIYQN